AWPLEAHAFSDFGGDLLELGAKPGALDRAAAALGRGDHNAHHVRWDGEADTLRATRTRLDRRIDANQPPVGIDQRAAGIARIGSGIGLDEEPVVADADLRPRDCGHDAVRHRLPDTERITDRQHDVADLQFVGIAELEHREALVRTLDAQDGEVAVL